MNASWKQGFMTRRAAMQAVGGAAALGILPDSLRAAPPVERRTGMGLVVYDCNIRRRWLRQQDPESNLFEPLTFLKYCHELGVGGMQASLGAMQPNDVRKLRDFAEQHELFIDAIIRPPVDEADVSRFDAQLNTARQVGAKAARTTIIPGRRYERFGSLAEFREYEKRGRTMLERAAPIVEKYKVPLAVENHKDQRIDERVRLFKQLDSEFIGACIDTGNSFALLDGAYEPIEALAPFAFSVHLKDQSLKEYEDGFLLGDIPLGDGSFDLKRMVKTIRDAKPDVRFSLELITRDPLKVPCFTPHYYATMPSTLASDLARTMRFVRKNTRPLQQVSSLSLEKQVQLENANVATSIRYAGEKLGL